MTYSEDLETRESHCIIDGVERSSARVREVRSPYDNRLVTRVYDADSGVVEAALSAGKSGVDIMADLSPRRRRALLLKAASLLEDQSEAIAHTLALETGKVIRDCRTELARSVDVITLSAEESIRICGRQIPLEASAAGEGKLAYTARFPVGLVAGIVPFNAPVTLTCHKVAPALAAGNAIIVKAPPQAPRTTELAVRAFLDAGFPPQAISLLHGNKEAGEQLVADPRVDFLSFTGSHTAGLSIKAKSGTRGCILELGGVGPTIVHRDADLERAATMACQAGFRLAGQSCASVQNLFVQKEVSDRFSEILVEKVSALKIGDPLDPYSDLGPVIDENAAARIQATVKDAVAQGAKMLTGGQREGMMISPIVLSMVEPEMTVARSEIFGPVVALRTYEDIEQVFDWIKKSEMGINCGIFTDSQSLALRAFREIPAAAIILNGTSTFRPDQMPYGGVRKSGYGKESPKETIRAMTLERILVFS